MWKLDWFVGLHAPRSWAGNMVALVIVRKKFILHLVPLAWPLSTLNKPSGTLAAEVHVLASRSRVVSAVSPSTIGAPQKAVTNKKPTTQTKEEKKKKALNVTLLGLTSNSRYVVGSLVPW